MNDDEINGGDLSPCVRIFIESLLNDELTTTEEGDTDAFEKSVAIKKGSRQADRPEQKSTR